MQLRGPWTWNDRRFLCQQPSECDLSRRRLLSYRRRNVANGSVDAGLLLWSGAHRRCPFTARQRRNDSLLVGPPVGASPVLGEVGVYSHLAAAATQRCFGL